MASFLQEAGPVLTAEEQASLLEDPTPLRIVATGDAADNYSFTLDKANLSFVLGQVPAGMEVSVVSVVGAFRTGKSFILSLFLRYLRHAGDEAEGGGEEGEEESGSSWLEADGLQVTEGNCNDTNQPEGQAPLRMKSFKWRGGAERQTTGIWMWSRPFIKTLPNGQEVAVLVVDTQGMFDNETSMGLTACIFGLSTLISSHQIYNVEKRIQEDHLQQLALFSEYGRMALAQDGEAPKRKRKQQKKQGQEVDTASQPGPEAGEVEGDDEEATPQAPPFQRVEFLIRDWQNFEDEEDTKGMLREMGEYLEAVIGERAVKDLRETREQITSCFDKIGCFALPHPGFAVTKKNFSGDLDKIEPLFKRLLDVYVRRLFEDDLEAKVIHGRAITAPELQTYIVAYVKLFQDGAAFPEAKTMLEATAGANNASAAHMGSLTYCSEMDTVCGARCKEFVSAEVFLERHERSKAEALDTFETIATMGRAEAVDKARQDMLAAIEKDRERYEALNSARNPFQNLEYYIIPMMIAASAFVLRWIADVTCSGWSDTCRAASHTAGHLYMGIFAFLLLVSSKGIMLFLRRLRVFFPAGSMLAEKLKTS